MDLRPRRRRRGRRRRLRDFRRSTQNSLLEFKGGWMNGQALSPDGRRRDRPAAEPRGP
jgi:hypothetical protein